MEQEIANLGNARLAALIGGQIMQNTFLAARIDVLTNALRTLEVKEAQRDNPSPQSPSSDVIGATIPVSNSSNG